MKRKFLIFTAIFAAIISMLVTLPACDADPHGDIKSITKPYISEYECVEARLGNDNLLEKYDYIKLTLLDGEQMELSYKLKDGDKKSYLCDYEIDDKTREITADFWLLGIEHREKVAIENGGFTIAKNLFGKPLVMKFKTK